MDTELIIDNPKSFSPAFSGANLVSNKMELLPDPMIADESILPPPATMLMLPAPHKVSPTGGKGIWLAIILILLGAVMILGAYGYNHYQELQTNYTALTIAQAQYVEIETAYQDLQLGETPTVFATDTLGQQDELQRTQDKLTQLIDKLKSTNGSATGNNLTRQYFQQVLNHLNFYYDYQDVYKRLDDLAAKVNVVLLSKQLLSAHTANELQQSADAIKGEMKQVQDLIDLLNNDSFADPELTTYVQLASKPLQKYLQDSNDIVASLEAIAASVNAHKVREAESRMVDLKSKLQNWHSFSTAKYSQDEQLQKIEQELQSKITNQRSNLKRLSGDVSESYKQSLANLQSDPLWQFTQLH